MARLPDINEWANNAAKKGIETVKNILADKYNLTIEKIAELAKAEADGTLIKLPCKVGDKIYFIKSFFTYCKPPVSATVGMFKSFSNTTITFGATTSQEHAERKFTSYDIGKTVFLSQSEAEKALGG